MDKRQKAYRDERLASHVFRHPPRRLDVQRVFDASGNWEEGQGAGSLVVRRFTEKIRRESDEAKAMFGSYAQWPTVQHPGANFMSDIDIADEVTENVSSQPSGTRECLPRGKCAILDLDKGRANTIDETLSRVGHLCRQFASTAELFHYLYLTSVDVIILGKQVREGAGVTLARLLRGFPDSSDIPIMMLGSANDEELVELLSAGVDFFLQWPFNSGLLTAHVHALLRLTCGWYQTGSRQTYGAYRFDHTQERVYLDGEIVDLTRKEFQVAALLFRSLSRVVTFDDFIARIWGVDVNDRSRYRTVVVHLSQIRKKLRLTGESGYRLVSARARGYKVVQVAYA